MPGALESDAVHEHDRHEERESECTDRIESAQREQREDDGEQRVAKQASCGKDSREQSVDHATGDARRESGEKYGDGALHGDRMLRVGSEERDGVHREPTAPAEDREPEECTEQEAAKPVAHGGNIGATRRSRQNGA